MQTYIVVTAFVTYHYLYQVSANIHQQLYSVHPGYEATNVYEELSVSSVSGCAVSCNISTECITATFDSQTRQCKLSDLDLGVANNTGNMVMKSVFPAKVLNVALKKPASMSSSSLDRVASRAVDGNTNQDFFDGNSCFHTLVEANPWWRVDLGNDYYIAYAVLYNRMDNNQDIRAHDVVVKVGPNITSLLTIEYIPGVLPAIHKVHMPYMQTAKYLEVSIQSLTNSDNETFHLCEIEVFGYPVMNIALKKPASLSSVSDDRVPSRAVDGNTNQDFFGNSCFHTLNEINPWWRVDLGIVYHLDYTVIYNRMDNGQDVRAHDILCKVGIELSSMYTIEFLPGTLPSIHVVQMPDSTEARFLEVSIQSLTDPANDIFHLCEIEVFGYPGCSKFLLSHLGIQPKMTR
ncbi:hypothetical protein ACF0H5_017212 [Mactra antiquata]